MDLIYYITFHYFHKKPKWMVLQEAVDLIPKDLDDILWDLAVKIFILFTILYLVRRVFMSLYTLHDGRRRRLRRLHRIYKDLLKSERQRQEDAQKRNERNNRNNIQVQPLPQEE